MDEARENSSATTFGTGMLNTPHILLHTVCTLASSCEGQGENRWPGQQGR